MGRAKEGSNGARGENMTGWNMHPELELRLDRFIQELHNYGYGVGRNSV